ncbi:protein TASOR isoform X1 [Seriola aureovittata]|uniref:protein TASOR isoform X1 n=1 Tax=Seriola aureovittata TaxID=2871759 RepID=UPI0024BE9C20|nr:protein TASOR isoform X1 [Seriola aureovittata]
MDDILARREAARPRRMSSVAAATAAAGAAAAAAAVGTAELGANVSLQDGEVIELQPPRETLTGLEILGAAGGRMERRNSASQIVHQRHMPMEPKKFHIPRKTRENRALVEHVSTESREFENMMTILTSSYIDTGSAGCVTYSSPRLVHSELLEKEFVEKRKEMKVDGRTDKELEESYGFLLAETDKVPMLCEKGLCVGHSWITVLGNPTKGVYLSRYSDLLQINSFTPGATGEIVIFKVMKGKVKSIYENMKNLLDPTPRFDSHISKNASKVTSLSSYRAFELTQQYFYEYLFDELRQRPRQVCPYAVVSFQFKGKDSALPSKPLAPIRLNSQSAEGSKERAQFTVWSGDLVKGDQVLFQISLRSFSPPFLPHRLPEKLTMGCLMRLEQVTKLLPSDLFSYNLYNSSQEVVKNGYCCSLLEVVDRSRSTTSVTKLLQELEIKRMVLVTPLTERGFLFLLSSVQMATPTERGESWSRCLQALFVFPETRDVARSTSRCASLSHDASESLMSGATVMPRLSQFIPSLHHALVKARANPPPDLSAGVERQAQEYLTGLNDGKVRQYPMGEYDSKLDEQGKPFPAPKHHRVNMDGYLRSYLYNPALYLLSVARARQVMEVYSGPEEPQARPRKSCGGQRESTGKELTGSTRDKQINTQKVKTDIRIQQLIDLVLTSKRNAENEVKREEGGEGGLKTPGRKRRLEQQTAERTLKYLRASQGSRSHDKIPVEGSQVSASPGSLASVIGSVGLRDVDLREDGSEHAAKLLSLLTGLTQAARGMAGPSFGEMQEVEQKESCPFDRLATKLGLPTNCDIDLRKQEELEEQTAGSVSSLEGFSPSSHSGEMNHHGAACRGGGGVGGGGGGGGALGRRAGGYEEDEEEGMIPWVLIPITGLCSQRYTQRDRNIPQDPRFQHLTTATSITPTTETPRKSPTLSPEPSPPPSPFQCPSPEPSPPLSPSQCPSPEPSPPLSPSQCPSPEPSPPLSPSQCPSPEPSPPVSPSQCPSPQPSPPTSPSQCPSPQPSPPPSPSHCPSLERNHHHKFNKGNSGANEEHLAPTASREFAGVSKHRQAKPQGKEKKKEEPFLSSIQPSIRPATERRPSPSPPSVQGPQDVKEETGEVKELDVVLLEKEKETVQKQGEEATESMQDEVEEVVLIHEVGNEKNPKGEVEELIGRSVFSRSISSPPPARPPRDIDSIVDKHLGDFSSDIQLLLQDESVHYSFPQSTHSTSKTETSAPQHTLPHTSISQFSQYVSFYNPCPPVQDYVSSLQESINGMLKEFGESWPSQRADTSRTDADNALANTVSAFVASIRAANTKTGSDDEDSAPCGELTAADGSASVSRTPAHSRGGEVRRPDAITRPTPDANDSRNPPTSHVTLSVPTSSSGSVHKPADTDSLHPPSNKLQHQQSHALEINRTLAHTVRQTQDSSVTRTVYCTNDGEGGSSLPGSNSEITLPGCSRVSEPLAEPSHLSELGSSSASVSIPAPPATALSSLISQLQPEVFSSLVEIIKDVKKNSLQFYLHSTEPGDQVYEDVKEHLLKQGNTEQSPVAFLNQENSDDRLLVIIKNKDIAAHIHKIPNLVSLKRHPSVAFVGIDTLDDIRNNSYNELFVSGGCIVSDELVLSSDFITHGRLAALLIFLEQHSSPESVWKWKVHYKTHKKLKEQTRFRRDAANIVDLLSTYQKRQIVEFLPYHHCDMMNHQSPDLDCLLELQARYTQYRHTIFLTEHRFETFPAYSNGGIIVAGIEDILHSFTRLVGYHHIKDKQPIMDDLLATKGLSRQLSHGDSVSGSDRSPSIFPEHIHPLSSGDQPQKLLQQPGSGLHPLPHLSDQLVPDASCKDGVSQPSDADLEVLRRAISQFRAERQAQLQQEQQLDSQAELSINPLRSFLPNPIRTGSGHTTPPVGQGGPAESVQLTPGRKAVADTLELIHSGLQPEMLEEERRKDRVEPPTEGERRRSRGGGREPGVCSPGRAAGFLGGNRGPNNSHMSTPSSNHNTAAVTGPSDHRDSSSVGREKADQQGEPSFLKAAKHCAASSCPVEGDRSRDAQRGVQEQPIRGEGAPPGNSTASGTKVTGSVTMVTDQEDNPNPALQQPQQHLQQLNNQQQPFQPSRSHLPPPAHSQQQQHWGSSLLQHPFLPRHHSQHYSPRPMLRPLTAIGRTRGLLGPTPVWPGGLGPSGAASLVWGFQQVGTGPSLLGGYHNPAGQGGNRYRGGQRGGFNGM